MLNRVSLFIVTIATMFCGLEPLTAQVPCVVTATVTTAGTSSIIDNRRIGCYQWRFVYINTGFSAISVQVEEAPDAGGTPGTWAAFTGATVVTDGSNPSTSTNAALIGIHSAAAWVRVNLATATGAGSVTYTLWGANSTSNIAGLTGSSGAVTGVTGTAPILSSGGTTPAISLSGVTAEQGNGSKVQLSTGTTTTNDCVKFDANGNTIDAGAACGTGGSSAFTTQTDATLSRVVGTVYQNTTGGPVWISASFNMVSGFSQMDAFSDATTNPSQIVAQTHQTEGGTLSEPLYFMVVSGNYYKVTAQNGTVSSINFWIEYHQ